MATWFSASAVVPQLRDDWGLSRNAAAWLTIAVQLGFVGGALASSLLNVADVIAPHIVVFVGSLGAAVANAALTATHGPGGAIPLRLVTGFFLAGVYPPALRDRPAADLGGCGTRPLLGYHRRRRRRSSPRSSRSTPTRPTWEPPLALQLAVGFTLTVATIWLIPVLEGAVGWRWAFAFLAPGPALGTVAMIRLRSARC